MKFVPFICDLPLMLISPVARKQRNGICGWGNFIVTLGGIAGDHPGFRLRLHPGYVVGLGSAPVFGEATGSGGGEDGLSKLFDDFRDAVEAVAAGIDAGQQGVQFVGDTFLFGERGERKWNFLDIAFSQRWHSGCPGLV